MRKAKEVEGRHCPVCQSELNQVNYGKNRSGTQRCKCTSCGNTYTLNPKSRAYSEEVRQQAIKTYYSGVSGRGVGALFGMGKENVVRWIKKNEVIVEKCKDCLELDELYWFIERKSRTKTRENVYLMTMVSREPRQIVGFDVARDKCAWRIQRIVDGAPEAEKYCTDGYIGYLDVVYSGQHVRNMRDKSDTFTVEGVNADLRHYIPLLARRSRCFARTLETLQAVMEVFMDAYNGFGEAKYAYRQRQPKGGLPFSFVDFF